MSTIPTTLSAASVPYTVVGGGAGRPGPDSPPVSVVLLGRGARLYRGEVFSDLEKAGFSSVISVEEGGESLDVESLAGRYPGVRFLLLSGPASPGEKVNLGMRESSAPRVLVLWSDTRLATQAISSRFYERLAEQDILCQAPLASGRGGEPLPVAAAPALHRASLKVLGLVPVKDGTRSLFPFDYCGIYSRERFLLTGGFDPSLANPYWQRLDFGFRAWLWGEEIRVAQALRLAYDGDPPEEDQSPDASYKWFWLKNLAPRFGGDSASLPAGRFWAYLRSRRGGPLAALAEFRAARVWVAINRFRFRCDAASLVDLWEESAR